jgi:enoyl-CoA hydratase
MNETMDDHNGWIAGMRDAHDVLMGVIDVDVPVIAKINGDAFGLAATLALVCDIVIAKDTAKIGDAHVKIGLAAGDGGAIIWPELVGYARAKRYLLTGAPITGAKAAEIGLVSEAVTAEELDERVEQLAREIARGAGMAIRLTKRATNMSLKQKIAALLEAHLGLETMTHLSNDHREAIAAFGERRRPVFTGT